MKGMWQWGKGGKTQLKATVSSSTTIFEKKLQTARKHPKHFIFPQHANFQDIQSVGSSKQKVWKSSWLSKAYLFLKLSEIDNDPTVAVCALPEHGHE